MSAKDHAMPRSSMLFCSSACFACWLFSVSPSRPCSGSRIFEGKPCHAHSSFCFMTMLLVSHVTRHSQLQQLQDNAPGSKPTCFVSRLAAFAPSASLSEFAGTLNTALSVSRLTAALLISAFSISIRLTAAEHPPHFIPDTSNKTASVAAGQ